MEFLIGFIVVLVIVGMYVMSVYNKLVQLRNKVRDQWSQIEVHLKRRADLIPNLVETVKGFASHEKETLDAVISARAKAVNASTPAEEMKANGELSNALGRLLAVAEAYPELKANQNFLELQKELTETENKITFARQFYNDTALGLNNAVEMFPSNIVASMFNFKKADFFEADEASKEAPKVKF